MGVPPPQSQLFFRPFLDPESPFLPKSRIFENGFSAETKNFWSSPGGPGGLPGAPPGPPGASPGPPWGPRGPRGPCLPCLPFKGSVVCGEALELRRSLVSDTGPLSLGAELWALVEPVSIDFHSKWGPEGPCGGYWAKVRIPSQGQSIKSASPKKGPGSRKSQA